MHAQIDGIPLNMFRDALLVERERQDRHRAPLPTRAWSKNSMPSRSSPSFGASRSLRLRPRSSVPAVVCSTSAKRTSFGLCRTTRGFVIEATPENRVVVKLDVEEADDVVLRRILSLARARRAG